MAIDVRLGGPADVEAALSVYEQSNLARRHGVWPARAPRLAQVTTNLHDTASWFLIGREGDEAVAMAVVLPFRADRATGAVVEGSSFLDLIYVLPDRWGQGIGGAVLDEVIEEAARRGARRIYLWTHERDNQRAHRLYRRRAFHRTGTTGEDDQGEPVAEWVRDG